MDCWQNGCDGEEIQDLMAPILPPSTAMARQQRGEKRPFDIDHVLARIREAVAPFAKAAMFELRDRGYGTAFQQLVGCMVSIRTRDEVSLLAAVRLLQVAPDAETMSRLDAQEIDTLIDDVTFHTPKSRQIRDLAVRVIEEFGGTVPCDTDVMQSFVGVGPKCAHLAAGIACGHQRISVDVHVHRVTNRWGYVSAKTPEATLAVLEQKLPKQYWIEINQLLVPFGKHICTGHLPKCSTCPVLAYCRQVGVTAHR
jgi:endonuclease III